VVPPNQAEIMYEGLKKRGIMTSLVMYPGEQHGFRGATAIRRTLDGMPCTALILYCTLDCTGAPMHGPHPVLHW
jgi:acetyl esterase/lipase